MTPSPRPVRIIGTGRAAQRVWAEIARAGGQVLGVHWRPDTVDGGTYHALVTVPDDEQEVA